MVNTEFRCAASGWTHHFKSKLKNTLRVHWLGSARLGLARFTSCSHSLFVSSARFGSQTLQKLHQFGVLFVCLFASLPPLSPPPLLPVPLDPHNPVQLGVTRYSTGRAAAISVPLRAAPCSSSPAALRASCSRRPDGTLRGGAESVHQPPPLLLIYGRDTWLSSPHGPVVGAAL